MIKILKTKNSTLFKDNITNNQNLYLSRQANNLKFIKL